MNKEQKSVVLDAAQEMQVNDEWWLEFEFKDIDNCWYPCTETINPWGRLWSDTFRRKPKAITVTIPVPHKSEGYIHSEKGLLLWFNDSEKRNKALAAIRGGMKCSD